MIVQALLFGFLLLLQGETRRVETFDRQFQEVAEVEIRGWPEVLSAKYLSHEDREKAFPGALRRNMTCIFAIVLLAFLLQEAYLRRRKPLLTIGRLAGFLLLSTIVFCGIWRAQRQYRQHEFMWPKDGWVATERGLLVPQPSDYWPVFFPNTRCMNSMARRNGSA